MKYLAHRDQESEREQSLIDHLEKTAELAGQYEKRSVHISGDTAQAYFMI